MGHYKNISSQNGLVAVETAPLSQVSKQQMEDAVKRVRAIIPGGQGMATETIITIANESLLYRTQPGRDFHYYEKRDKDGRPTLQRIPDYKYLKNFANFKEQMLSGDDTATVEERCRPLDADGKERHGIKEHCIAAECIITTARERRAFAAEVKQWRDIGFDPGEAVEMARETYGELGTRAVGVVDPTEKDRFGKPLTPPFGWSFLQWAEKLAFKNAVNRKYGIPTADEMAAYAYRMAHKAMPEHWKFDSLGEPADVQARLADLEATAQESKDEAAGMNGERHAARLAGNTALMRGSDEGIGESDRERFEARVLAEIKFYNKPQDITAALKEMKLKYDPENEEFLFEQLDTYASQKADAAADVKNLTLDM